MLKLTYANCENLTSTCSVYSVYARDKEVIAHWVVFAVCNGRIVFLLGSYRLQVVHAEVVVDLQIA